MRTLITVCIFLSLSVIPGRPQPPAAVSLKGEVLHGSQTPVDRLFVELYDPGRHVLAQKTAVMPDGSFEFRAVEAGTHQLRLVTENGTVLREDFIQAGPNAFPVAVRLPENNTSQPLSGLVSVGRLQHKIPKQAAKEYHLSRKEFHASDLRSSIAHLEKALAIDPDYPEARNDLGVRYMALDERDKARAEFEAAVALDPSFGLAHANLSAALLTLRRPEAAERAARKAVQLDPKSVKAHYLLGLSLLNQKRYTPEALQNLQMSVDQFPKARVAAAQFYAESGATEKARSELQTYLNSSTVENRAAIEYWLKSLR